MLPFHPLISYCGNVTINYNFGKWKYYTESSAYQGNGWWQAQFDYQVFKFVIN